MRYGAIVFPTLLVDFNCNALGFSTNLPFMGGDRIRFSHILPVVDLALLVLLVFVPITMTTLHLYQASNGSDQVHLHNGQFDITIPRDQIVLWAIRVVTVSKARTMMVINLPGALFQWLISLPSSSGSRFGWHPQALALDTWRALVFPFFALPFWWLVGCGLDTLLGRLRLHWSLLLTGTLLFAIYLTLALDLRFGTSAIERANAVWAVPGLIGWTIAFAILPIAWITQSVRLRLTDQH
jgi:hypothetical protein